MFDIANAEKEQEQAESNQHRKAQSAGNDPITVDGRLENVNTISQWQDIGYRSDPVDRIHAITFVSQDRSCFH